MKPEAESPERTIAARVRSRLEFEPRVNLHRYPVRIEISSDGTVALEGDVESIAAKKIALRLAASEPGVTGIVDRLRVVPVRPMGDGEIRDHVRDALVGEPALSECAIAIREDDRLKTIRAGEEPVHKRLEIEVRDRVVTLNGVVDSLAQKRIAGLLAWWVPGARDVVNGIGVWPPQDDSDDEIRDAVRFALEKDPLVNAPQVRTRVKDAAVTLEGIVANDQESAAAEADAWHTFGVDRVYNRLERR
jgi:osmotically-inducible protein OsmY